MSEFFHAIDSGTWEKPEVFAIAEALNVTQGDAFLACVCMWDYFRRNSTDGTVTGVTAAVIDRQVRLPGFAAAAMSVQWLKEIPGGLEQPGFAYHLHGCESLKAFRHRNRAKKSNNKQDIIEALRSIDPEAASRAEASKRESQGSVREKRNQSKTESKRENETKTERNGEDSSSRAVPEDSVSNRRKRNLEVQSQTSATVDRAAESDFTENRKPKTENGEAPVNGPASVKLGDLAKMPLLARLDAVPVTSSGMQILGSVFSPDRIKPEDIERAETTFWLGWYRDQLGSQSPALRCGTAAEACYVLASVLAVRRIKGVKKIALWVKWIRSRECGSITKDDWRKAAERIESALAIQFPESKPAAVAPLSDTAATSIRATTKELTKRPRMTRADLAKRAAELRERDTAKAS